MKNQFTILSLTLLMLLAAVSPKLQAADEANGKRPPKPLGEKPSPEEREARLKELRKTNNVVSREELEKRRNQFLKLSPEEREAKRKELKERLEKRIAELREKKTNTTLSAQEVRELERREQILKRFEQEPPPARGEKPKPPGDRKPAQ